MAGFLLRGSPTVLPLNALRQEQVDARAQAALDAVLPATQPWQSPRPSTGDDESLGPRVLLLTSSLGSGHVRAAQAIELAMNELDFGANVMTLDFWSLMDAKVAWAVRTAYLRLVQEHPDLFDRLYQLDQRMWRAILDRSAPPPAAFAEVMALMPPVGSAAVTGDEGVQYPSDRLMLPLLIAALSGHPRAIASGSRLIRLGLVQSAWARLSRRLAEEVRAFDPHVVVATQMNSAALLSSARSKGGVHAPTIGVPTDFGLHDFWMQTGIEHYCVAHDSVEGLRSTGLDASRVTATGIPLMPGFSRPPAMGPARKSLGLDPGTPVALIAGGGLGLGVHVVAEKLLAGGSPLQLVVIAGHNGSARRALMPLSVRHPRRLLVHEWTDNMELFIRAADVVVGKPGGLTVAEVLACGRPLIATRALGGQEGFNVRFLQRHGVGCLVSEADLVSAVENLLENPGTLRRMQERAWSLGRRDGAARVAALAQDLADRRSSQRIEGKH